MTGLLKGSTDTPSLLKQTAFAFVPHTASKRATEKQTRLIFEVKVGRRWQTVRPRVSVGYYFIAPGREPEIEFGVEDTGSIVDLARKYFKLPAL